MSKAKRPPHCPLPLHSSYGRAMPVILMNDKGQVALIAHDKAPMFRVFGNGNGITEKDQKKTSPFLVNGKNIYTKSHDEQNIYRRSTQRILSHETNLPIKLIKRMEKIFTSRFIYDDAASSQSTLNERNHHYVLNIGSFPLESKKGAFIELFDQDKIPKNMTLGHHAIVQESLLRINEPGKHASHVDFHVNTLNSVAELMSLQRADFSSAKKWADWPPVVAKRAAGTLKSDLPSA